MYIDVTGKKYPCIPHPKGKWDKQVLSTLRITTYFITYVYLYFSIIDRRRYGLIELCNKSEASNIDRARCKPSPKFTRVGNYRHWIKTCNKASLNKPERTPGMTVQREGWNMWERNLECDNEGLVLRSQALVKVEQFKKTDMMKISVTLRMD